MFFIFLGETIALGGVANWLGAGACWALCGMFVVLNALEPWNWIDRVGGEE